MHQKTIDAIVKHNDMASSLLSAVSGFGKELQWQIKEPIDPTAEYVEIRMLTADMRGLMSMFAEVDEFVDATVEADADRLDVAFSKE